MAEIIDQEDEYAQLLEEQKQLERNLKMSPEKDEEAESFELPNLIGSSKRRAESTLSELGLQSFVYEVPSDLPSGYVMATQPFPESEVVVGQRVILIISKPKQKEEDKDKEKDNEKEETEEPEGGSEKEVKEVDEGEAENIGESAGDELSGEGLENALDAANEAAESMEAGEGTALAGEGVEAVAEAGSIAEGAAATGVAEGTIAVGGGAAAAGGAVAAEGVGAAAVSSAPIWVPVVAIILLIIVGTILGMIVLITTLSFCNSGGLTGTLAKAGSVVANVIGVTPNDTCGGLASLGNSLGIGNGNTSTGGNPNNVGDDTANRDWLALYHITVNKNDCTAVGQTNCTSLDNTLPGTIQEVIDLASACDKALGGDGTTNKCGVEITGGSEAGHTESGSCTHGNGFKVDLASTDALNAYITNPANFTKIATRSDGAPQYIRIASGDTYADERAIGGGGPHWDITVGC